MQATGRALRLTARTLYVVGIQTTRILHRLRRRLRRFFAPARRLFKHACYVLIGSRIHWVCEEARYLYRASLTSLQKMRQLKLADHRMLGTERHRFWTRIFRHFGNAFGFLINIAAPLAAIALLLHTVHYWTGQSYGLALEVNGTQIGLVQNEGNVGDVINMAADRISSADTDLSTVITPTYKLTTITDKDHFTSYNVLCDTIISATDDDSIQKATGLYVDNAFVAAIQSRTDLRFILQTILKRSESEDGTLNAAFVQDVQLVDGMYTNDSILTSDEMHTLLTDTKEVEQTYTVREGDAPLSIAAKLGMTLSELQALNPDIDLSTDIHVGDKLVISSEKGFFTIKQVKEITYTKPIPYETVKQKTSSLYIGSSKVSVKGEQGQSEVVDRVTYVDGVEVDRENIRTTVIKQPVTQVMLVGTKAKPTMYYENFTGNTGSTGTYTWPVPSSKWVGDGYGYVSGRLHQAIDIICTYATVVAADAGQVIQSGWHYGYGWCVLIQHDNGMQTFYAHCSRLNVMAGDKVKKGQAIALSGNTGSWSTGPHLHFEVRNSAGVKLNPYKYLR